MTSTNNTNDHIAQYVLGREIGRGGFGKVYEALDSSGTTKALKILSPTPFISQEQIERVISNTIAISHKCASLNVVLLRDHGRFDQQFYIVTDYYRNGSLDAMLLRSTLSYDDKIRFLLSAANTLAEIHRMGIVHGDIKPANFLLSDNNTLFLTDFYYDLNNGPSSGLPKGTIEFMSPEQAQGKLFSYQSDVYSLGVMAYLMFTAKSPFSKSSGIRELIIDKIDGRFPPPSSLSQEIGQELDAIILKAMNSSLENRFASMNDFSKAISGISKEKQNGGILSCFTKLFCYLKTKKR